MARTVDFPKKAEKIKGQIDELVSELLGEMALAAPKKRKLKISEIDFEDADLATLAGIQARISRLIVEKSR